MIDITEISLDDKKTWEMICEGKTKGCFQIESHLGKTWCQKVKPSNISELSDVISIIRPGVLKFVFDGKSMAQHYSDRKNGIDEAIPLDPSLTDILKDTYQVILYQEQIIEIAKEIAGFSESEGDTLRKGVGKKDAELLNSLEEKFIQGCVDKGIVTKEIAELIFANIKKSARYLFNKSHAVSYAYIAYWSAYLKANYPREFYLNWLKQAEDKIDPDQEMKELISSARSDGIRVSPPSIDLIEDNFTLDKNGIHFGFCNVKNVGINEFRKISEKMKDAHYDSWNEMLLALLTFNKRTVDNLVYTGCFDKYKFSRLEKIHQLSCLRELTAKEFNWLIDNWKDDTLVNNLYSLSVTKSEGGGASSERRSLAIRDLINRLKNPGRDLSDNPSMLSKIERKLLGCEISFSELEGCADASYANCTCEQFINRDHPKLVVLAATIISYREILTKNKEKMCFLTIEDSSTQMENVIVFPDVYEQFAGIIYVDSTLLITGQRSSKGDSSFIVEQLEQI